ncbi:MAG: efflux RND transporter permease subunit [Gammaproteobacteria bacterium]
MEDRGLIAMFARHPVAGNLLMWILILFGIWGAGSISRQVLPNFTIEKIRVTVQWPGASPEDIESNVLEAIEPEIRFLEKVSRVDSVAAEGRAEIIIDFENDVNISKALTDVQSAVSRITTFPQDMERPVVSQIVNSDLVCRIEVSGPFPEAALKRYARRVRDDLLNLGLSEVRMTGLRKSEIHVEIPADTLRALDLTAGDVATRIAVASLDMPAGSIESGNVSRQLRTEHLARSARELAAVEVVSRSTGEKLALRDIAVVSEDFEEGGVSRRTGGYQSIGMMVMRSPGIDSVDAQRMIAAYMDELRAELPPTLKVDMYDVFADQATQRVRMVIENGLQGIVLVLLVLFLFMNARIAWWVAWGIPVSVLATLGAMAALGLSLNLISMFAILMAIGIIVDDAIVVAESAEVMHRRGSSPDEAVMTAVRRMAPAVIAAGLTTVAGFMPVLAIGATVGKIIRELPITVCVAVFFSLVECLLVLPMHLRHALERLDRQGGVNVNPFGAALARAGSGLRRWPALAGYRLVEAREKFLLRFRAFREGNFARFTAQCYRHRYSTVLATLCTLVVTVSMFATGRVGFEFFASPETDLFFGNFSFTPGTPREQTAKMVEEMGRAARAAEAKLTGGKGGLIRYQVGSIGTNESRPGEAIQTGDHAGGYTVELISGDLREVHNAAFIRAWRDEVQLLPGVERLNVMDMSAGGPPGRDLDMRLSGAPLRVLKVAAVELQDHVADIPGIISVSDNLPWGKQELVMDLTPAGRAMGFTTQSVARQVRDAFEGAIAKRFPRDQEEVIVRVKLARPDDSPDTIRDLYLRAPDGSEVPLPEVVDLKSRVGFSEIRREDGLRQVSVSADVDYDVTTTNEIAALLRKSVLPELIRKHGVHVEFKGKAVEQARALGEFRTALMLALSAIYIILAWVFSSYTRPLVVMAIIPFGLVGAVIGHWVMGYNINMLSLQALLGLSGVLVNDTIVLLQTVEQHRAGGAAFADAVLQAVRDRLRPVILTTGTTIGGVVSLLFEGSLQAQLVQPIAVTLIFGLLFSPFLVFLFAPAMLGIGEDLRRWRRGDGEPGGTPAGDTPAAA